MTRYIVRRFLALLAIAVASTVIIFVALQFVPGDPAVLILGQDATPESLREMRQELGLDQTVWKQYVDFMGGLLQGDLGRSYQRGVPVIERIADAYKVTFVLSSVAMTISIVVGIAIGLGSALKANTWIDHVLRVLLLTSTSIPVYWLGLLLIYAFAVYWGVFPSFGWGSPMHLILPAITLATYPLATIGRVTRSTMLDVLSEEYVRTARAKGLPERIVVLRHALRNAFIPILTVIGLQFGVLLAGAVLTETVFSVPGMGQLLINAIFSRDYAVIRGTVLVGVVTVVTLNLVVDILYLFVDPRIRY